MTMDGHTRLNALLSGRYDSTLRNAMRYSVSIMVFIAFAALPGCNRDSKPGLEPLVDSAPDTAPDPGPPPVVLQSIRISPENPVVVAGADQAFTATGDYSDGSSKDLTDAAAWSFTSTSSFAYLSTGAPLVKTVGQGIGTVSATVTSVTGTATLRASPPEVTRLTLSRSAATLAIGSETDFIVTATDTTQNSDVFTGAACTIADSAIATAAAGVVPGCRIRALASGHTSLTAAFGNLAVTAAIEVLPFESLGLEAGSPKIGVDSAGAITAAWGARGGTFGVRRFLPSQGWMEPQSFSALSGNPWDSALAIAPNGRGLLVWPGLGSLYSRSFDPISGWQDGTFFIDTSGHWPAVGIRDDGVAQMTWGDDTSFARYSALYVPDTGWLAPEPLPVGAGGTPTHHPLPNASGQEIITWAHYGDGSNQNGIWTVPTTVYAAVYADNAWTPAVELDAAQATAPMAAINDAGDAIVLWTRNNTADLYAARRRADGTWEAPVLVTSVYGAAPMWVGIDDSGRAMALWFSNTRIFAARFTPAAGWSEPQLLAVSGRGLRAGMDQSGNVLTVWLDADTPDLSVRRFSVDTGWQPEERVVTNSGSFAFSDFTMNASGSAAIAGTIEVEHWISDGSYLRSVSEAIIGCVPFVVENRKAYPLGDHATGPGEGHNRGRIRL